MMACVAATERSEKQWHELVGSAGLKIEKIWTNVPEAESIIVELALEERRAVMYDMQSMKVQQQYFRACTYIESCTIYCVVGGPGPTLS